MTETLSIAKKRFITIIILAVLGIAFSTYLSVHYYEIKTGTSSFNSLCNINSSVNCDVVAASPYAEFAAGIPLSSFAAGWFLTILILGIFLFSNTYRKEAIRFGFVLAFIGLLNSLFYFWVMAAVLKTWCLFCLLVDAVNVALFAVFLSLKPVHPRKQKLEFDHYKLLGGTWIACMILGIVLMKGLEPEGGPDKRQILEIAQSYFNTNPTALPKNESLLSLGNPNAPIQIVEFSDFQCPHCRYGAKILKSVMDRYPNKIHLTVMNYPLDSACNPKVTRPMHTAACEAAHAAICAEKFQKFEPLYEMLFERQEELAPGKPLEFAKSLGLSEDAMKSCMNADETNKIVLKSLELGDLVGVAGTPTFFLNDRKVPGVIPLAAWSAIIDQIIAGSKSAK